MAQGDAAVKTSEKSKRGGDSGLKKINTRVNELVNIQQVIHRRVRLMFQDEAGFGRINKPKYCWCFPGLRPTVPCHHIREYRYAYGAVEPLTGDSFFLVLPYCNTDCMNVYLQGLSAAYPNDYILLATDGAAWHKAKRLQIPENIELFFLPPATPERNPIEQIWKELRKRGFKNEIFQTLNKVVVRLCDTICSLSNATIKSITARDWIVSIF
jgi:putative transposase